MKTSSHSVSGSLQISQGRAVIAKLRTLLRVFNNLSQKVYELLATLARRGGKCMTI